jgi:hypothetical protein
VSIVSSTFAVGAAQKDGRVFVLEKHTDNLGIVWPRSYGPVAANSNFASIMATAATQIALQIEVNEYLTKVAADASPLPFVYQTAAQFAAKYRFDYQNSLGFSAAYLAYWIINRINAGDFTDLQVQNAFGLTSTQYTTLKITKFVPQHDAYASALAAVGQ